LYIAGFTSYTIDKIIGNPPLGGFSSKKRRILYALMRKIFQELLF